MYTYCRTSERSFSRLKLLKTVLRSSLSQNNIQNLGILSIESEFVKSLDFRDVIQTFAIEKARKKELCFDEEDKQVDSATMTATNFIIIYVFTYNLKMYLID